ncbi:unnamed protein product [Ectocarpus sp. CCAP 1310/34]|nr:unnamed protein product [Ectocarpus sp. CCAP 1310/34]
MEDIFGPEPTADIPAEAAASETNKNLEEFDDIFGDGSTAAPAAGEGAGGSSSEQAKDAPAVPAAASGGSGLDEFDDIFGDSEPVEAANAGETEDVAAGGAPSATGEDSTPAVAAAAGPGAAAAATDATGEARGAGGDKEFLDFLYDGDDAGSGEAASEPPPATAKSPATAMLGSAGSPPFGRKSPDSNSTLGEEGSFLEIPPTITSPFQALEEVAGPDSRPASGPLEGSPLNLPIAEESTATATAASEPKPSSPVPTATLETYVRKERAEVLRPLPDDPAAALREVASPGVPPTGDGGDSQEEGTAAADDVGYVRRLCAATGGFLPPDLRPVVWGLLLGRGRKPSDAGFLKWRARRREALAAGAADAPAVSYKLDLRNDCLALARRLCDDDNVAGENDGGGAGNGASCEGGGAKKDPEALAFDIEEVLTFYCTRRSEAYEPVLCALVGPLFSMGLDAPAVSTMLNPLVGSVTLFLGRGLTHAVRDLAWAHAHRRLHDLCTYHDPELVQHLNRSFPGWEMPLPGASASHAETSALDQEASAMVDDLESSLEGFAPRRRSMKAGSAAQAEAVGGAAAGGPAAAAAAAGRPARAAGKGLVEPSLLVAANAALGASAPLGRLLPLWDYLLVRHDKHFGFFLLLAALLRRREELLLATGPQLRLLLAETLSPSAMASLLVDGEESLEGEAAAAAATVVAPALALWCQEAEALDLATPESFRHHLALIGEIAEAEHEAAVRARARRRAEGGSGGPDGKAVEVPASSGSKEAGPAADSGSPLAPTSPRPQAAGQAGAEASKGLGHPSLLRMRTMMKTAGDKLAADFKNLKVGKGSCRIFLFPILTLARPNPENFRQSREGLAPPTELSLPQLCLAVSAKELVAGVSGRRRERAATGDGSGEAGARGAKGVDAEGRQGSLFRQRQPLAFFAVDCRPKQQVDAGRFPTAYHLDPSAMENPEEMAEKIMPVFEPLRKRAHVCLIGSGDGHLRARGLADGNGHQVGGGIGSQRAARDDYSYVNTCALFFVKRGFPYVSVLEGGYAAAHELVTDTMAAGAEGVGDVALSAVIVDHITAACRLCLVQKPGGASAPVGSKFPLSPPLWERMGAADSSTHGIIASTDDSCKGSGKKGSESPFFPTKSPGTEKTSSSSHSSASARSGGDVVSGGEGSGHDSSATAPPVAAAGTTTGSSSSNMFRGGTMFSGMKINMGEIFKKGAATSNDPEGGASAEAAGSEGSSNTTAQAAADKPEEAGKGDREPATDLAAKLRISLGRFGSLKEVKKDTDGAGSEAATAAAAAGGSSEKDKDSGIGSLFRKAQSFKAADVAAAFADLRDGPKTFGAASPTEVEEVLGEEEDDDDDAGELFVIGDDESETSENPDSDFEGFDGEHPPPRAGGARTAADKEVALLEHRLSGQIKGATMVSVVGCGMGTLTVLLAVGDLAVVDDFLKVPGAKVFTVTKHKVTFHDVDATPETSSPDSSTSTASPENDAEGEDAKARTTEEMGVAGDSEVEASGNADGEEEEEEEEEESRQQEEGSKKKVRVRAVTELERVVFLSRERILVLACPSGPTSPGLVKSNHHLTELQKMTFMRRDPSLVTLHYLAPGGQQEDGSPGATKRNVYRFGLDDKEAFIRIIRGALQRFQA